MTAHAILASYGGATPVALVEQPAAAESGSVTFAATPANGRLIILIAWSNNGTATVNTPTGFTLAASVKQGSDRPLAIFYRVASSEASATYSVTVTSGNARVQGLVLSGQASSPIGNTDSNFDDTTGVSLACGGTGISVSDGSFVIAAIVTGGINTSAMSFSNSFASVIESNRGAHASRSYSGAASAQNSTGSWTTTSTFRRGLLLEIKAP